MSLAELIDLTLGFFFTNDRCTLSVSETLHDTLMVKLLLFLLLLLLLELKAHELDLLLAYGLILHSLALQRFVGILKLLDDLFKFLNALRVDLVFFLLGRILLDELSLEP